MLDLPDELWIKIINYLDLDNLISLAVVNKYFFYITKFNHFWDVDYSLKNYNKKIKFLNHCHNIKYLKDYTTTFKFYISEYTKLLNNNLKSIKIRAFNNYDLDLLRYNKDLKILDIKSCYNIDNYTFLSILDNLKNITSLGISNSVINNDIISILNKFKLEYLKLEACINLNKIDTLKQKNIKNLKIISQQFLENSILNNLLSKLDKLKHLTLSIVNVDIKSIHIISKLGKNLKSLDISYPQKKIDNTALFVIASSLKNLEILNLNGTDVSDDGIEYLVKKCKKIYKLSIAGTYISDMSLVYIGIYLEDLNFLEAAFNNISRIGVFNLIFRSKKLKYLNILNNMFTSDYLNSIYKNLQLK